METDMTPTPAEIDLLARLETAMKRVHDTQPAHCRWPETARAALDVVADWQQEQQTPDCGILVTTEYTNDPRAGGTAEGLAQEE